MAPAELAQIRGHAGCMGMMSSMEMILPKWLWGGGVLGVRSAAMAAANLAFIKPFFRTLLKPFQM